MEQYVLAEIEYFSGNVDAAAGLVDRALTELTAMPDHEQDQKLLSGLLQNAALVRGASGDWATALCRQQQALAIRQAPKTPAE